MGNPLSRRDFLKIAAAHWVALGLPLKTNLPLVFDEVGLLFDQLPTNIRNIFRLVPRLVIDQSGYLFQVDQNGSSAVQACLAPTQWNIERRNRFERLFEDVSWGIVLHWFGASLEDDDSLAGYLRGFDGMRWVGDYETRTSAHFLVGSEKFELDADPGSEVVSIVQTQLPDSDGVPFVASHLHALDYDAHRARQQYFVRAMYELENQYTNLHSVLTDIYDGPRRDPNYRTIAIEITGSNFDEPGNFPPDQQIANLLGLIWALMKRYKIYLVNIFGHHEIELRKSDPGKHFMAFIRYLMVLKGLVENDPEMNRLIFHPFGGEKSIYESGMRSIKFARDHLILVDEPNRVYAWDRHSRFWEMINLFTEITGTSGISEITHPFTRFQLPVRSLVKLKGDIFLEPENHEGVDLFLDLNKTPFAPATYENVYLAANGECVFTGRGEVCGYGYVSIFRHYEPSGGEILTVYGHMHELSNIQIKHYYPVGYRLGSFQRSGTLGEGYLHFAIAYGATWNTVLSKRPILPKEIQANWIQKRYLSPMNYVRDWLSPGSPLHQD